MEGFQWKKDMIQGIAVDPEFQGEDLTAKVFTNLIQTTEEESLYLEIRLLAHVAQRLAQGGGAADGVAIGAHMGEDEDAVHAAQTGGNVADVHRETSLNKDG